QIIRKSRRISMAQQKTKNRMLHYITASVHPLFDDDDDDDGESKGLTTDAFPSAFPLELDPKEPPVESVPQQPHLLHTSPRDPFLAATSNIPTADAATTADTTSHASL